MSVAVDYTANGYESAIETQMLATNCAFCGRELRDADSVESGIGPVCREKFGVMDSHGSVDDKLIQRGLRGSPVEMRADIAPHVDSGDYHAATMRAIWHGSLAVSYGGPEKGQVLAALQQIATGCGYPRVGQRILSFYAHSKIRLERAPDGGTFVRTPKNQVFIDALKKLPYKDRRWDRDARAWWVSKGNLAHVAACLSAAFPRELMTDLKGNLVMIPADVQFPPPKTPPAPAPDCATGETDVPPIEEIKKLQKGDKVVAPDGKTKTIGWIGETRGEWRLGVYGPGQDGMTFYSYTEIKLIPAERVAKKQNKEHKAASKAAAAEGAPLPAPPPPARNIPDVAFPYQIEGIKWLDAKGSTLLADEPGLGKTLQACAATDPPCLVVCPAAMRVEWAREMNRWRPDLSVSVLKGRPKKGTKNLDQYSADVVIINYDILTAHAPELIKIDWETFIADEAHYLKTLKQKGRERELTGSARAKASAELALKSNRRFLLTATPIMNRVIELWPLLHMVDDARWNSYTDFGKRYCNGYLKELPGGRGRTWDFTGSSNVEELNALLTSQFMLRRTKDVLDLPPKSRQTRLIALEASVAREYDKAAKDFKQWVYEKGGAEAAMKVERAKVLAQMTGLRKLAGVGKVDYAVEWSATHLEATGRPLVIMAHHRDVTLGIAKQLTARDVEVDGIVRKIRVGKIIGGMTEAKRTADKDAFQRGELDVLVCSIQAAGVGLTLTAASETLFVERAWRPSDLVQAEDRIWRIGQDNKCTIIYLDAANTIDDVIAQMLQNKQSTIAGVIDGLDLDADQAQDFVFGTMFGLHGEVKRVAGKKAPRRLDEYDDDQPLANPQLTLPRIEWARASSL